MRAHTYMAILQIEQGTGACSGCYLSLKGQSRSCAYQIRFTRANSSYRRAYALQKHRALTLHATINLPDSEHDRSPSLNGFIYLVKLYRPCDDKFVGLWNKTIEEGSADWIIELHEQLLNALPGELDTMESQAADLRVSQHWLRTVVWQLSTVNGYLSSSSPAACMTFQYPVEIARHLVSDTSRLSKQAMEVHGIGLVSLACSPVQQMS